jgi:hypothetical protein
MTHLRPRPYGREQDLSDKILGVDPLPHLFYRGAGDGAILPILR